MDKDGKCHWYTGLFTPDVTWPPCFLKNLTIPKVIIIGCFPIWTVLGIWGITELLKSW